jgi:hypothetical protein
MSVPGTPRAVPGLESGEVAPIGDPRRAILLDDVEERVILAPVLDVPGARRVVDAAVAVSIEERRVLAWAQILIVGNSVVVGVVRNERWPGIRPANALRLERSQTHKKDRENRAEYR